MRSSTIRAVQPQKMAVGLKLHIQKVEGLYYLCSKNKIADDCTLTAQPISILVFAYAENIDFFIMQLK